MNWKLIQKVNVMLISPIAVTIGPLAFLFSVFTLFSFGSLTFVEFSTWTFLEWSGMVMYLCMFLFPVSAIVCINQSGKRFKAQRYKEAAIFSFVPLIIFWIGFFATCLAFSGATSI